MIDFSKITHQQTRERFQTLPYAVQEMLMSEELSQTVHMLARKHSLHIDQEEAIHNVVALTLYGFVPSDDLPAEIEAHTHLGGDVIRNVVEELNTKIFNSIHEKMREQGSHTENKEVPTKLLAAQMPENGLSPVDVGVINTPLPGVTPASQTPGTLNQLTKPTGIQKPSADPYREPIN